MTQAMRKGWCPSALRPMPAKDGLLVRLRITGGILTATNALALADLAERCGSGLFDLSGRGNLQMRGVREDALARLQDGLQALGLLDDDAEAEAVRNVIASPLAGLHDGLDIRPLVAALERRLADDPRLHALPAKFGFLIDDGSRPSLADVNADVRFDWDGEGFAVGLGGTRKRAMSAGMCKCSEMTDRAALLASAFITIANQTPEAHRMRHISDSVAKACRASPSPACGRRWPDEIGSDEGSLRLPNKDDRSGMAPHPTLADARATLSREREKVGARHIVGPHTFASTPVLGLAAPFGRLDAAMLRAAARLAEATTLGELRLTPWRVILVPGTSAEASLPGFITDSTDARLAVAACVGTDGCSRGTTPTQQDAARLAQHLRFDPRDGITLHVSGCAKGCAKPSPSPITLVAQDGRYDIVRDGRAGDPPVRRGLDLDGVRVALDTMTATA